MDKAKNTARSNFISGIQSAPDRAIALGRDAIFYNDPNLINTMLDKIKAVTKEDIRRMAQKYLQPSNRAVVITLPQPKTGEVRQGQTN